MKNFRSVFVLILAAVFMAGCNPLKKMQNNAGTINYQVTPEILETHGGEVALTIKGVFPEKYFDKSTTAVGTPVLVYEGGEVAFDKVTLQGEKVLANNEVINYTGDNFTYTSKVPYKDAMKKSELYLRITATRKTKSLDFEPVKLADGVIATSTLTEGTAKPVMVKDNYQRIIPESQTAAIYYLINRADIRSTELKAEELQLLRQYINTVNQAENLQFTGVAISSYASPDGKLDFNEKLSQKRGEAADKFVKSDFQKIEEANKEGFFTNKTTAEDWDGFRTEVEASSIRDKELILRVLSMYSDPAVREEQIRNMAEAFEVLKTDILPKLRRSKLIINANKIGRSDQEILAQMKSDPKVLDLEEMLYSSTLTTDLNEQLRFYQAAAESYPKCIRAHNNIAYTQIKLGRYADAVKSLEAAKAIQNNDVVKNNLGYATLLQGDLAKAEEYFTSMTAATADSRFGLGMIAVVRGQYDQAVNYFGNEASYNLGHALLLKKDYTRAKVIFDSVEPNASGKVSYMKAVLGARMEDRDYMLNNLRQAVGYDANWKSYAKTDLEFAKFFVDNTFMSIVQ
jgi:tetratricopeptide (TPR) repeat protein